MIAIEDLYIMDVREFTETLYRMGNSTSPNFSEQRAQRDIVIRKIENIDVVVANGNGFSAFSHLTEIMRKPGKHVWCIRKGATLPQGIRLVEDRRPGHDGHFIAPETDMPLKKYLGLLEELGLDRSRVRLLSAQEIANG